MTASKVNVGGGEIVYAFASVVVVRDERADADLQVAGQTIVLEQDAVFWGLIPALR